VNNKAMICPLLSVVKMPPVECLRDKCAWWVEHYSCKCGLVGGDCALTVVADNLDNGLVCLVSGNS
jgi:hypothetical protein